MERQSYVKYIKGEIYVIIICSFTKMEKVHQANPILKTFNGRKLGRTSKHCIFYMDTNKSSHVIFDEQVKVSINSSLLTIDFLSSNPMWSSRGIYDVFLSFRGEDTRKNFVSLLHAALCNVGVNTFLDDDKLDKGQMLQSELWNAIENSHIAIVVFSKTYAQSSWCVLELVKIMEERRIVLPVFYDVDPSDVRHQKGAFAEDLEGNGLRYNFVWGSQKAFTEAANLVGWDLRNYKNESKGTENVKGLALKLPRASIVCYKTNTFQKMTRLRLLQLDQLQLIGDYGYLSKHLRWVNWQGFPLEYIPNNFYMGNLVAFVFKNSNLSLVWRKPQLLECLKILNLSHSRHLKSTPDFSKLPNLEELVLKDCPSLSKVDQSIGDLSNIFVINLKDCTSLSNLPTRIYTLKSVKILILSGCEKIDKLEEDIVQMESLTTLLADNTSIKQVPFSIVRAKNIGYMSLCGYEGLARNVFPSLIWSWMSPTMNSVHYIHQFQSMLSSAVSVNVQNNNWSDVSPMLRGLSKLRSLWVQCRSNFQLTQDLQRILAEVYDASFTELETRSYMSDSLKSLMIGIGSYHRVLDFLSNSLSQGLAANGSDSFFLPGDNYPYWLTRNGEGHSVLFKVPHLGDNCIKGMIFCVVYSSISEIMAAECLAGVFIINRTNCTIQLYKKDTVKSFNDEDWQGLVSNLRPNNEMEILVAFGHGLTVKKTAVYLVYQESIDMKMGPLLKLEQTDLRTKVRLILTQKSESQSSLPQTKKKKIVEKSVEEKQREYEELKKKQKKKEQRRNKIKGSGLKKTLRSKKVLNLVDLVTKKMKAFPKCLKGWQPIARPKNLGLEDGSQSLCFLWQLVLKKVPLLSCW
ncbi:hypothetical protein VNO77_09350 [Canavalia gladiata]|uniref:TIR domain-containing protein n=1 Tax=Canavalia gladiata TaxID=3824 RepID=A0AAN9MAQ7_CANGL